MKTLMIGTLIAVLMSSTVLASTTGDGPTEDSAAAGSEHYSSEQKIQSEQQVQTGNPEQTPYIPHLNNRSFAGTYPYEGNFPDTSNAYAYPNKQTVVVPAAGDNTIRRGSDIDHSSYIQMVNPES